MKIAGYAWSNPIRLLPGFCSPRVLQDGVHERVERSVAVMVAILLWTRQRLAMA
jgi:hypothetical protein